MLGRGVHCLPPPPNSLSNKLFKFLFSVHVFLNFMRRPGCGYGAGGSQVSTPPHPLNDTSELEHKETAAAVHGEKNEAQRWPKIKA